jgi:hypothetical protein
MRPLTCLAAVLLAAAAFADDPKPEPAGDPKPDPADDPKAIAESEKNFEEFFTTWSKILEKMPEGLSRKFKVEATGAEMPVTGTMTVIRKSPETGQRYEKKTELDNRKELREKRVALPPLLANPVWGEPMPIKLPERSLVALDKDAELKVGDRTLKCLRITVTTGPDAPMANTTSDWWITEEDGLGFVKNTAKIGDKTLTVEITSWNFEGK